MVKCLECSSEYPFRNFIISLGVACLIPIAVIPFLNSSALIPVSITLVVAYAVGLWIAYECCMKKPEDSIFSVICCLKSSDADEDDVGISDVNHGYSTRDHTTSSEPDNAPVTYLVLDETLQSGPEKDGPPPYSPPPLYDELAISPIAKM